MTARYEALVLADRFTGDFWHLHPEIRPVVGWWPDGAPALAPDPDWGDARRLVLGIIPKRQPEEPDGTWLEDHPAVERLIDIAIALNDLFWPRRCSPIADAAASGIDQAWAQAILAHLRLAVGPDRAMEVLELAQRIARERVTNPKGTA